MIIPQYRALARYNQWMNEKIYASAATLSDDVRKADRGAFFRSLSGTLNHLLLADRVWMARFTGDPDKYASLDPRGVAIPITSLAQELYSDFDALKRQREQTDRDIRAWVDTLDEAKLAGTLRYCPLTGGAEQAHPLGWAVAHFFNHQTHHRGQATTLLMQAGQDPGVTDLLAMLRTEPPPA